MRAINLFAFKALNLEGACESLHSSKLPFHNYICLLGGEIKVKTVHKNNQNDKISIERNLSCGQSSKTQGCQGGCQKNETFCMP